MSTKFNPAASKMAPPPQCHKSPEPPVPPPPLYLPERLIGWVSWIDPDPLAPLSGCQVFLLPKIAGQSKYEGKGQPGYYQFGATVELTAPPNTWSVTIRAWDQWRNPEEIDMGQVTMDPDSRFDTGLLIDIHIPGYDERYCRFTD